MTGSDPLTLLAVEPAIEIRTLYQLIFSRLGYRVILEMNGCEGIEWLQRGDEPAAIILDDFYRGCGRKLLEYLNDRSPQLLARVIVVTTLDVEASFARTVRAFPIRCVIRKPFDIGRIVEEVRACCGEVAAPAEAR